MQREAERGGESLTIARQEEEVVVVVDEKDGRGGERRAEAQKRVDEALGIRRGARSHESPHAARNARREGWSFVSGVTTQATGIRALPSGRMTLRPPKTQANVVCMPPSAARAGPESRKRSQWEPPSMPGKRLEIPWKTARPGRGKSSSTVPLPDSRIRRRGARRPPRLADDEAIVARLRAVSDAPRRGSKSRGTNALDGGLARIRRAGREQPRDWSPPRPWRRARSSATSARRLPPALARSKLLDQAPPSARAACAGRSPAFGLRVGRGAPD